MVFAVDDDASMREALSRLFRSVGIRAQIFASAQDFLMCKRPDVPACLVLDVRLPGLSGLDLQRELAAANFEIPIIFITGHGDIPMSVQAMKAGAVEFLTKPFRDQALLDAIHQAVQRDSANRKRQAEIAEQRARYDSLTQRERQVLGLVATGLPNKQIAAKLGTTEFTVKIQRKGCHAKDAGRIVGRVGADGGKVRHSLHKGLVTLYQRVITGPTDSCVNFSANSGDAHTQLEPAHHGRLAVCADALKGGGLNEERL